MNAGPRRSPKPLLSALQIGNLGAGVLLCASLLAFPSFAAAQTAQTGGSSAGTSESHRTKPEGQHARKHSARHLRERQHTSSGKPSPEKTTAPAPVPPAQQQPAAATVDFHQGQLRIDARNSSLVQILKKVSGETGLAVEGLNRDERIYGQYGPGSVTDTLTALLNGAGYNYVIVGGGANTPPTKLLLTSQGSGSASAEPVNAQNGNGLIAPGGATPASANPSEPPHPKTPQEIFNELRRMHPQ